MLEHSTRQLTLDELISSQEGSPVNHSAQLEKDLERKTNAICGPQCLESFGRLNQATLWARTFADYLIGQGDWYSKRCALTWKLKGTKSHRIYFQLAVKTHPTEEIESGLLLTTTSVMTDEHPDKMRARVEKNGYKNGTKYGSLVSQVKYSGMLPTPTTMDIKPTEERLKKRTEYRKSIGRKWVAGCLTEHVYHGMLPTPLASEGGKMSGSPTENQMSVTKLARMGMLPTPNAMDWNTARTKEKWEADKKKYADKGINLHESLRQKARLISGKPSQLNPLFVEEMMGFPENWTVLPFQSGEKKVSKHTETR